MVKIKELQDELLSVLKAMGGTSDSVKPDELCLVFLFIKLFVWSYFQATGSLSDFTAEEKNELLKISPAQCYDATFLRRGMELLYKNDPLRILKKSRTGCKGRAYLNRNGVPVICTEKEPMTPEKVEILKRNLNIRIKSLNLPTAEENARLQQKRVDQMFATTLNYIHKEKLGSTTTSG